MQQPTKRTRRSYPDFIPGDYHANHRAIRKARGPAWQHQCERCDSKAQSWATVHGKDGSSVDDYTPLCWSCHAKYDDLVKNLPDNTGSKRSPETREKIRQKALGRKHSPETIAKLRENHRSGVDRPEVRAKMSESHRGKTLSAETKAKISEANRGRKMSDEQREKLRQVALADPEKHRLSVMKGWETRRARQKEQSGGDLNDSNSRE